MRFPSLFKLPKYQQFEIKPRYYDPIKEDIAARKARIKKELERRRKGGAAPEEPDHHSNISEAFAKRRKKGANASILQFFMMLLFLSTVFGYIYLGNDALYLLLVILPIYLLVRLKNIY